MRMNEKTTHEYTNRGFRNCNKQRKEGRKEGRELDETEDEKRTERKERGGIGGGGDSIDFLGF